MKWKHNILEEMYGTKPLQKNRRKISNKWLQLLPKKLEKEDGIKLKTS